MLDKTKIKSILVIKMRNIGDVLLTSPLFANLRLHFPEARICALVNSGTGEMLTDNPDIDHIHIYDRSVKKESWIKRVNTEFRLLAGIRKEHFDLVINLTEGDRGAVAALLSGARIRLGVNSLNRGFRGKDKIYTTLLPQPPIEMHAVDQNLRFLSALGLKAVHKRVSFKFPESVKRDILSRLETSGLEPKKFYHAHVTSRWMFKTMPPAKMAFLLDTLSERTGLKAVLEAAPIPKELDYLHSVLSFCRYPHVTWEGDVSLKELGALSSLAQFHVGIDSAPMHIAAALDVHVLGIFGPLPVSNWGPWDNSQNTNPYQLPRGIQTTGRHMVLQSSLPCVPCHRDGCNGSKKSDCLDFSFEELDHVITTFIQILKNE
ncbi:MAG TPA: putative lipopolysaccharide heptosyltransferase III [Geobacter sp.]|nr:putative lipopolysaccharide heptosyltransferase III [Geobacter sp.]HCE66816.1 putative lipopolysaccharide heptosyltransferase III [Geobacter sp.]